VTSVITSVPEAPGVPAVVKIGPMSRIVSV